MPVFFAKAVLVNFCRSPFISAVNNAFLPDSFSPSNSDASFFILSLNLEIDSPKCNRSLARLSMFSWEISGVVAIFAPRSLSLYALLAIMLSRLSTLLNSGLFFWSWYFLLSASICNLTVWFKASLSVMLLPLSTASVGDFLPLATSLANSTNLSLTVFIEPPMLSNREIVSAIDPPNLIKLVLTLPIFARTFSSSAYWSLAANISVSDDARNSSNSLTIASSPASVELTVLSATADLAVGLFLNPAEISSAIRS